MRYWQLRAHTLNGSTPFLSAIELRTQVGGVDVAPQAAVSASYESGQYSAVNLTDGNAATAWAGSSALRAYAITFDFGVAPRAIAAITLRDASYASAFDSLVLLRSDDAQIWEAMAPAIGIPAVGSAVETVLVGGATARAGAPGVRLPNSRALAFQARSSRLGVRHDVTDGGSGSISGNVYLKGPPQVPSGRRVRLHDSLTGRLVREVWSDAATGAYRFDRIRPGPYYVVSFDHTNVQNAVIKDRIQAA